MSNGDKPSAKGAHTSSASSDDEGVFVGPPGPLDILVGRGFQYENHPGNATFYQEIDLTLPEYENASTKKQKTQLVKRIYNTLTASGQFVKLLSPEGNYKIVEETEAKQKISHALRYRKQQLLPAMKEAESLEDATANAKDKLPKKRKQVSSVTFEKHKDISPHSPDRNPSASNERPSLDLFSGIDIDSVLGRPEDYLQQAALGSGENLLFDLEQSVHVSESTSTSGYPSQSSSLAEGSQYATNDSNDDAKQPSYDVVMPAPAAVSHPNRAHYPFAPIAVGVDELSHIEGNSHDAPTDSPPSAGDAS